MPALRILVSGRVQGVGFRNYVQIAAQSLGIGGEVWNRSDGSVEAHAEHADRSRLDAFAKLLEAGPGYVKHVLIEEGSEQGYEFFSVGPTR